MALKSGNKSVALVTGASSGLGKSFVKALLSQGIVVYAAARRVEQMSDLAALGATVVGMDITRRRADCRRRTEYRSCTWFSRYLDQQCRLWPVWRYGRHAHRRGAPAVRGQLLRHGPTDAAGSSLHAGEEGRHELSTSPPWGASSTALWRAGITRRSMRSRAGRTASA